MSDYSLDLNEDQLTIQKWVHDFAEDVVRPAAHEWDEREEFPWPVVQEAAKIGLYGFDFMANAFADPTGLTLPVAIEELFWGDAGIGLSIFGLGPRRRRHQRQRHPRADRGVGAPVLRHRRRREARRLLRERARRRLRRVARCAPGPSTTRPPTSGCSTAPRRGSPTAASPTCTSSWPPSTPTLRARGQASFVVPPGHRRAVAGPEVQEARHPRLAHRRGRARRRAGAGPLPARRQGASSTRSWPGPARPGTRRRSSRRWRPSRPPGPSVGRPGRRHRPGRLRVRPGVRQGARWRSASRSS